MNVFSTVGQNFSPLSNRNLRIYLGGQAVSLIGTWLQHTAQGWVVWTLTGSTVNLSVVSVLGTVPILLLGPWAGTWADRWDRRKLLIWTQVAAMMLAFILAFLVFTNTVQLWHVYVMSAILGVITALDMPAQQAFIGDLTGTGEIRKAVNLNAMILQVSRMLGPAFAGIIVGALGAATAFLLNGFSFLAVIVSLLLVRSAQVRNTTDEKQGNGFLESLRFIRSQPRLLDLMIFVTLLTFFGMSIILNILPAVADTMLRGDAETLGLLMASSGAGALIGTVLLVPVAQSLKRAGLVVGAAAIWTGFWYVMLSFTQIVPLAMLTLFMVSLGAPIVMTTAIGLIQFMAPPQMRARLMSVFLMVSFGMQPLAALMIGFTADVLGIPLAIEINGILLMLGAAALLFVRSPLRTWEVNLTPKAKRIPAVEGAD
jgi:MFS family permease